LEFFEKDAKMLKATISFSLLFAMFMLAATDAVAKGEVYRWVDKDGVIHFDQQPGDHKEAVKIDVQKDVGGNEAPAPAAAPEPEPSLTQQRRDERAKKRQEAAEQRAANDKVCAQARQRVADLEPSPRVIVENEDGSVSRMDDEKRLELLEDARAYIATNCNS